MRWRLKSPASRLFTQPFIQGADQRKHQSSASLAFVREIHRWPVNSPHKRPVTRKMFPFYDVIINCLKGKFIPWPILMQLTFSEGTLHFQGLDSVLRSRLKCRPVSHSAEKTKSQNTEIPFLVRRRGRDKMVVRDITLYKNTASRPFYLRNEFVAIWQYLYIGFES